MSEEHGHPIHLKIFSGYGLGPRKLHSCQPNLAYVLDAYEKALKDQQEEWEYSVLLRLEHQRSVE